MTPANVANAKIVTSRETPPEKYINAKIAGFPFLVHFNIDSEKEKSFLPEGTCKKCTCEFSAFSESRSGRYYGYLIKELKVEIVHYNCKNFTADSVRHSNKFVKSIFNKIIIAMNKQFCNKIICNKCFDDFLSKEMLIYEQGKDSQTEIAIARKLIEELWK